MSVDERVRRTLDVSRVVDLTTIGRKSGKLHRMEIPCFNVEGRLFVIGDPRTHDERRELRPRDWYANVVADGRCTVHLKTSFDRDLRVSSPGVIGVLDYDNLIEAEAHALARPVLDPDERRRVLDHILGRLRRAKPLEERTAEVNDWVEHAPVIELELLDPIGPT